MAVLLQMGLEILYNHLADRRKGFRLLLLEFSEFFGCFPNSEYPKPMGFSMFFPGSSSPIGRRLRTASPCAAALFPPGSLGGMGGMPNSTAGWPDIRAAGRKGGGTFRWGSVGGGIWVCLKIVYP